MKPKILFTLILAAIIVSKAGNAQPWHPPKRTCHDIIQIEASEDFSFLLKQDNSLWATGNNEQGQLGDGTFQNKHQFIKIMEGVKMVSTGKAHTLILKVDNTLWVAGNNEDGQIGLDTILRTSQPIKLMGAVKECLAVDFCSYILDESGNFFVVGREALHLEPNIKPQLLCKNSRSIPKQYYDAKYNGDEAKNLKLPVGIMLKSSYNHITMFLKNDNTLWSNFLDKGSLFVISPPQNEEGIEQRNFNHFDDITNNVYAFALGNTYVLIYKYDGTLWALGNNYSGQLGDSTLINRAQLTQLPIPE